MSETPLVTVVIPTYDRAGVICRTIDNVLGQTYRNIEVIVVDDGSTDDTQARLRQYSGRIRVITQTNAGPAAARNRGIEMSRGEFVAFQDSDDLWMPTKLERQVALLQQVDQSVPCCLCNATMRFTNQPITTSFELARLLPQCEEGIWRNVPEVLATRFVLFNQCVAIRRKVLERIHGFDETLKYMEDYDLPLRLSLEGGRWAVIREPLVIWQEGSPGSWSEKARMDEICMKECALKIQKMVFDKIKNVNQHASLRRYLKRELKRNRRELTIARIRRMDLVGATAVASLLRQVERSRTAIYRRTPSFPRAQFEVLTNKSLNPT